MTKKAEKEKVYSGVAQGPYKKWYDEWLLTPEGQAVAAESWGVSVGDIKTICPRGEPARKAEEKRQRKPN